MPAIKHIIECNCILPQFMNRPDPPMHRFIVFSVTKDGVDPQDPSAVDTLEEKYISCENCAAVHRVYDQCRSEIVGDEALSSVLSLDDIKLALPERLVAVLEKHDVRLYSWEEIKWMYDNEMWGESVVLGSDDIAGKRQLKRLILLDRDRFGLKIETYDTILSLDI